MSDYEYELRRAGEVIATGRIQLDDEPAAGELLELGKQRVRIQDVLFLGLRRRIVLVELGG